MNQKPRRSSGKSKAAASNPKSNVELDGVLSEDLLAKLPPATGETWRTIAPLLPASAYLAGGTALTVHLFHRISRDLDIFLEQPEDLVLLWAAIAAAGDGLATQHDDRTINCVFNGTRLQVLEASTQKLVGPTTTVGGLRVASVEDVMAMKLKVIVDRGELRDYYDLMAIEERTSLLVETGIPLSVERYAPANVDQYVDSIVRSLGYFGDVADDPELPVARTDIERYWERRQRPLMKHIAMYGG
jgi:hypothetical protein